MNQEPLTPPTTPEEAPSNDRVTIWSQHRFMLMIAGAVTVSLFLVAVAMALYSSSGAAQLDLSRPSYRSDKAQAVKEQKYDSFQNTGPINDQSLKDFRTLFDKTAKQATSVDAYGGDVMSDAVLGLDAPPASSSNSQ